MRSYVSTLLERVIKTVVNPNEIQVYTLFVMEFNNGDIDTFVQKVITRADSVSTTWQNSTRFNLSELN